MENNESFVKNTTVDCKLPNIWVQSTQHMGTKYPTHGYKIPDIWVQFYFVETRQMGTVTT